MDKDFMMRAIKEAKKSKESLKCSVVIVKNNKIISCSYNSQRENNDASAHAEIKAIRDAGKKLQNKYLTGCTIYCTCEPCTMCLSAMVFAKIDKLVYGLTLKDVSDKKRLIDIDILDFLEKSPLKFKIVSNFMKDQCSKLL